MKIKKGFILMKVGIQNIVVAVDDMAERFNGMIRLNETGEFLWKELEKGCTEQNLVKTYAEACEISMEEAGEEVRVFIKKLDEAGIVEE